MLHKGLTDGREHPRWKGFDESLVSGLCLNLASRCSHLGLFQTPCTWRRPRHPDSVGFRCAMGIFDLPLPHSYVLQSSGVTWPH